MNVLIACEYSGVVRDAFLRRGHNAFSCDLLPTESNHPDKFRHYLGDVLSVALESFNWDLMIAHPPCTYLTNAGVRWLYKAGRGKEPDPKRWEDMATAARFFTALQNAPIPRKCLENPIMHSHARALIEGSPTQTIQPWQFGHAETKATCLWLYDLPPLIATDIIAPDFEKYPRRVQLRRDTGEVRQGRGSGFATRIIGGGGGYEPRVHHASPGPERWKERSRTLTGIAEAMADQYGSLPPL